MGLFADNQRCLRSTVDGAVQAGPTKDKIWESQRRSVGAGYRWSGVDLGLDLGFWIRNPMGPNLGVEYGGVDLMPYVMISISPIYMGYPKATAIPHHTILRSM
jgi:hypothetical protein